MVDGKLDDQINDSKRQREELRKERNQPTEQSSQKVDGNQTGIKEIPNDETREQVTLLSEIKPNRNQENIKHMEGESKKMRRVHPRNLIKTQEEWEMMHSGCLLYTSRCV